MSQATEYQAEGRDVQTLRTTKESNSDWRTAGHNAPWALDKYKFLHTIERAWESQPDKDWYVFAKPDTDIVWRNLVRRFDLRIRDSAYLIAKRARRALENSAPRVRAVADVTVLSLQSRLYLDSTTAILLQRIVEHLKCLAA
ncbi:hypothetical protein KCU65_g6072, partial [Aureobasidium melanogenum]